MKFRMVKFARIPSYNQLFSGDPVWATLEVGGIGMDGRKMCIRDRSKRVRLALTPSPSQLRLRSAAPPKGEPRP